MGTNGLSMNINSNRILNYVSDAVISTDMDFNITSWNRAAEQIYGWKAVEVMRKPIVEVTELKYPYDHQEDVVQTFFEQGFWSGEVIQKHKNGDIVHILSSVSLIKGEADQPIGAVAVNRDITLRKQIEAERESLAKFPSENPNPVLRIAKNGAIMFANAAAQALLNKCHDDVRRSLLDSWNQQTQKALTSGIQVALEVAIIDRVFTFDVSPVVDADYVNVYGRDVTERRNMEEELKKSNWAMTERVKELTCLYQAIKAMNEIDSLDELGPLIVELLVPAMQFPEITAPVLELDGKRFTHSRYYEELTDNIFSDIVLASQKVGRLSVYYNKSLPFILPEEPNMLNALSESLSGWLHRHRMVAKIATYTHNLEDLVNERTLKLEESEKRARTQYQGIPIPILTWQKKDDDFILVDFNKANEVLTKGQIEHYLGVTANTFFEKNPDILEDLWLCYRDEATIKRERLYTLVTTGEPKYFALTYGFISPDLVLIHVEDISERKRLEEELTASEEKYRSLFLVARDGIIISDVHGTILTANPAAARILGYNNVRDLEGTSSLDLYVDSNKRTAIMTQLTNKGYLDNFEVILKQSDGSIVDVLSSSIIRKDKTGTISQVESIFTDISERKQAEKKMRSQLMKFWLEEGNLYLVKDRVPTLALEAFQDLLKVGYSGIVISRNTEREFRKIVDGSFHFYRLAERGTHVLSPTFDELQQVIEQYPRNTVYLLDGLDYLAVRNGFQETLFHVHWLKDYVCFTGNIGILLADPTLFTKRELTLFEKETQPISVKYPQISEDLLEMLNFISSQNAVGLQPKYADIQRHQRTSKPTASKKIRLLVESGYVQEYIKGSSKRLQLTYAGISLLSRT